jgi:hypothetical protein
LTLFFLAAGEVVEVGNFDPKLAAFWVDQGMPKRLLVDFFTTQMSLKEKQRGSINF